MTLALSDLPSVALEDRRSLPSGGGVYLVTEHDRIIYIGQSGAIRARWRNHHRLFDLATLTVVRIHWMAEESETSRQVLEKALIRQYRPRLNALLVEHRSILSALRLPDDVHRALRERAVKAGRSLTAEIGRILRDAVEDRRRRTA